MQITRGDQDAFAVESHRRAVDAINAGRFKDEIVPIHVPGRRCETIVDTDEHPRYKKDNGHYELDTSPGDISRAFLLPW